MTGDPIPPIIDMLSGIDAPVSVKHTTSPLPRIRLSLAGGLDTIPQIGHDQTLVQIVVFHDTIEDADAMARDARAALTPGEYAGTVVTKTRSTPLRYEDTDDWTPACGAVSFTARVWLH